jgi:hypothetical protein
MKLVSFSLDTWVATEVCAQLNAMGAADYVLNVWPDGHALNHGGNPVTLVICRVPDDFDVSRLPRA